MRETPGGGGGGGGGERGGGGGGALSPRGGARRTGDGRGEADAGEDIHVVALRRDEGAPVDLDRVKRAAGGDDRAAVGPLVRLLRRALGLRRRVRHRHHDRRLGVRHRAHELLGEEAGGLGGEAEEAGGLEGLDDVEHRRAVGDRRVDPRRAVGREAALVVGVAVRAVGLADRSDRRAHDEPRHRLFPRQPRLHHPVDDLLADAEPRRAGARAEERHLSDRRPGVPRGRQDPRQRHAAGPLDVVVEAAVLVSVRREDRQRLRRLEVFELHDDVRPAVEDGLHEQRGVRVRELRRIAPRIAPSVAPA